MLYLLTFCLFFSEICMCKGFLLNSNSENSTQHVVQLSKYLLMNEWCYLAKVNSSSKCLETFSKDSAILEELGIPMGECVLIVYWLLLCWACTQWAHTGGNVPGMTQLRRGNTSHTVSTMSCTSFILTLEGCGRHCGGPIILATVWILLIGRCHENKVGCSLLFVCFVLFCSLMEHLEHSFSYLRPENLELKIYLPHQAMWYGFNICFLLMSRVLRTHVVL